MSKHSLERPPSTLHALLGAWAHRVDAGVRPRLLAACILFLIGGVTAFGFVPLASDSSDVPVSQISTDLAALDLRSRVAALDPAGQQFIEEERVRRGDTLGTVLARLHVSDAAAENFVHGDARARALYQLRPGHLLQVSTDSAGSLVALRYDLGTDDGSSAGRALVVSRDPAGFQVSEVRGEHDARVEMRSARIEISLFAATDRAAIPDSVATQVADIFSGEIDFYRDLRRGDTLRVAYEMFDGATARSHPGRVLAVEFITSGHVHQAVWFESPGQAGNYYSASGQSMKRAFLKSPLEFTRISSGFGGRLHPILNTWRQHTGVDYAAPIGTPVRSTANGVIDFAGVQTGYGNVVIVRHAGAYATVYGHLSGFAAGLHRGSRVAQGDVIGRVGMTGWATGPHLHYEFRIDGVPRDPLRVTLPPAEPIAAEQLPLFRVRSAECARLLDLLRSADTLASATPLGETS